MSSNEENRAKELSEQENEKRDKSYKSASIYQNLTLQTIVGGTMQTLTGILNDLISYGKTEDDSIIEIFWKDDRMFFVGVLSLLICIILGLLNIMSGSGEYEEGSIVNGVENNSGDNGEGESSDL